MKASAGKFQGNPTAVRRLPFFAGESSRRHGLGLRASRVDDQLSPASGMAAQARLAFEGLKRTSAAAGAALDDVVKLTTFHIDLRGDLEQFAKVKDKYLPRNYPAWTAVGVTRLALPELLVEIRAMAIVGCGKE